MEGAVLVLRDERFVRMGSRWSGAWTAGPCGVGTATVLGVISAPLCPSCTQPASVGLAGREHGWECRNEACPEFGQLLRFDEEPPAEQPHPGRQAPTSSD